MQPIILRIPLAHLVASDAYPLTRENVIALARGRSEGASSEVHIVVTVAHDDDGMDIEVATVELSSTLDGSWCLQYVSHPAQSSGLTAAIAPCTSDLVAFMRRLEVRRLPRALSPLCAQELVDAGLGPLAVLNLRASNLAPVVPAKADLDQMEALADLGPTLSAYAGQSNKYGLGKLR